MTTCRGRIQPRSLLPKRKNEASTPTVVGLAPTTVVLDHGGLSSRSVRAPIHLVRLVRWCLLAGLLRRAPTSHVKHDPLLGPISDELVLRTHRAVAGSALNHCPLPSR